MKDSVLFKYLLNSGFLSIDQSETETMHSKDIKEAEEKLETFLTKEQFKNVKNLRYALESHMLTIRDKECFKMLYLGIALGIEVGNFINEESEEG